MRHQRASTLALVAALALSGCSTVRYKTALPAGGSVHELRAHYFLWGLVGSKDVYLDELCPQGTRGFSNRASFGNVLLAFVTLGIYVPRSIEVECTGTRQP